MKPETILNAMEKTHDNLVLVGPLHHKHLANLRQYHAFRSRLLRMFADKDARIQRILSQLDAHNLSFEFALVEKDTRIADIEEHNTRLEAELHKWRGEASYGGDGGGGLRKHEVGLLRPRGAEPAGCPWQPLPRGQPVQ